MGVADDVTGGTIAPGEFQQLENEIDPSSYPSRFVLLLEIIRDIAKVPGIKLADVEVKSLPPVPRCSYHMIDGDKPRCYLLASFRLEDGRQRYLLEIDTSDKRKTMSTRVMGFKVGLDARECIGRILKETVQGSLRWPSIMATLCEAMHAVHHPKERSAEAIHAKVADWGLRIRAVLS